MGRACSFAYTIPPDRKTWVERIERVCGVLEAMCPWGRLATAYEAGKADTVVPDRKRYLEGRLRHSAWLFNLGNGRSAGMRPGVHGWESTDSRHVQIGGRLTEIANPAYELRIRFTTQSWAECERVAVSVGDAVEAYSAAISPPAAAETLRAFHGVTAGYSAYTNRSEDVEQATKLTAALKAIGRQLPQIADPRLAGRADPAQPQDLGWLNYWSAATARYLGFPVVARDGDLLANSYRTPAGAWLVKLCPEPLDLDRPDHLGIYADVYARFPLLGVRAGAKNAKNPEPADYPWNTTFVQEENPWKVVEGLVPLLRDHGLKVVERITGKLAGKSLTVAVLPGSAGWSIVKTVPEEYLAEQPAEAGVPRLVALCQALRRPAFALNIYDPIQATLLETDGTGRLNTSGFREEAGEEPSAIAFELLPIDVDMLDLDDCGQLARKLEEELAGRNADLCDNRLFLAALNGGQLQQRQGVVLRFAPI